jgi:hypothetical protein
MALTAMASLFAAEARRTRDADADGQIRQMLLAASSIAPQRLEAWNGTTRAQTVKLPADLEGNLSLRIEPANGTEATVHVEATMGRRHGSETLRYARQGTGWELTGIEK